LGVDFTAIIDHKLTAAELAGLPERLNACWELPAALQAWVAKWVRGGRIRWEWKRAASPSLVNAELIEEGSVWLDGPDGFSGRVWPHAIELVHLARWWSFLYEPDVRAGLELACREVAAVVQAQHILYLPDNLAPPSAGADVLYAGGTVQDALSWLKSNVGPPVTDQTTLPGPDDDDPYGSVWFYERRAGRPVAAAD
jgi:hypothetical protein